MEFEVGHLYETDAGELWYVTDVTQNRVKTIILFSHVVSLCGRVSWIIPVIGWKDHIKKIT